MGKLFGTDGIRGVVGENLTADMAFRVGQAVGTVLMEDKGSRPTVVIGKDTRISSDMLESALMAGLCSVGSDVKPVGTIPTPAVAYLTVQEKADAGIVISASHNPYEHNGIKVFSGQGYKLSDSVEARIEEKILSQEPMKLRTRGEIGRRHHGMRQLKRDYIDFVASTIESDLAGLKILADCANGAASATAPELFGRFKARTDFIHRDPDGVNINSHCGSTHLEDLAAAVGATVLYPGRNVLIVDFGTAVTIDLVTADNTFRGGCISPGMKTRFRALHDYTACLPLCGPTESGELQGLTTEEAIRLGVMNSLTFEIEGYMARMEKKIDDLCVIFTGGDAKYFAKRIKNTIFANCNLVFCGLDRILEYNASEEHLD